MSSEVGDSCCGLLLLLLWVVIVVVVVAATLNCLCARWSVGYSFSHLSSVLFCLCQIVQSFTIIHNQAGSGGDNRKSERMVERLAKRKETEGASGG